MTSVGHSTPSAELKKPVPLNRAAFRKRLRTMPREDVLLMMLICFQHLDPEWREIAEFIEQCIPGDVRDVFAMEFAERQGLEVQ